MFYSLKYTAYNMIKTYMQSSLQAWSGQMLYTFVFVAGKSWSIGGKSALTTPSPHPRKANPEQITPTFVSIYRWKLVIDNTKNTAFSLIPYLLYLYDMSCVHNILLGLRQLSFWEWGERKWMWLESFDILPGPVKMV